MASIMNRKRQTPWLTKRPVTDTPKSNRAMQCSFQTSTHNTIFNNDKTAHRPHNNNNNNRLKQPSADASQTPAHAAGIRASAPG